MRALQAGLLAACLAACLPALRPVHAGKVDVWQTNLVSIDSSKYEARQGQYSGDFVFSFVVGIDNGRGDGRLSNFNSSETATQGEFSLDQIDPVDLSYHNNNLAVSFGSPNKILVLKNLTERMVAALPYEGNRDVVAGRVDISQNFVIVLEYELVSFPLPDEAENAIHVYSFAGDELVLTGSIVLGQGGFGSDVSLLPPTGSVDPDDPSKYYAADGSNAIYICKIDQAGNIDIDHKFDHPFTDVHIRNLELSRTGKFLAILDGMGVSILDTQTNPLQLRKQSGWLHTITSSICWSAYDLYLAVGTVNENTLIMDVQKNFSIYLNETLPGSPWETHWCAFSPSSGLLTMDSLRQPDFRTPISQNVTTYLVTEFPTGTVEVDGETIDLLPPLPNPPRNTEGGSDDAEGSQEVIAGTNEDKACFPGASGVQLDGGQLTTMAHLRLGDRVHVGGGIFEEVFFWSHQDAQSSSRFFAISFINQLTNLTGIITVSPLHYLHTQDGLRTAESITTSTQLYDGETNSPLRVTSTSIVHAQGLYNPHTASGKLVVDGVVTSCYTSTVPPRLAHALLRPLRKVLHRTPSFSISLSLAIDLLRTISLF